MVSVDWLVVVGCSQNSLTTQFPALLEDLPQVKRGTSHTSLPQVSLGLTATGGPHLDQEDIARVDSIPGIRVRLLDRDVVETRATQSC